MDDCKKDELIAILRERIAKLETKIEDMDKALTLAQENKEKAHDRMSHMMTAMIAAIVTAMGTLIGFIVHLIRGN
jgi:F0F1-type ATP synthase assembly protein I